MVWKRGKERIVQQNKNEEKIRRTKMIRDSGHVK